MSRFVVESVEIAGRIWHVGQLVRLQFTTDGSTFDGRPFTIESIHQDDVATWVQFVRRIIGEGVSDISLALYPGSLCVPLLEEVP